MTPLNTELEKSFRSLVVTLDHLPEDQARDFLARLALILAHEIGDSERFADAVRRAALPESGEVRA